VGFDPRPRVDTSVVLALEHLDSGRIEAVAGCLRRTFEGSGLPKAMLMDHGTPWWNASSPWGWTELSVWMMRQGIRILLSGYRHPQTQGRWSACTPHSVAP